MPRTRTLPQHSTSDLNLAYDAAQKVVETHRRLSTFLEPGQTLAQIDSFVAVTLADLGGKSCFRGYKAGKSPPFPSHACLSVNECIVHGTAGYLTRPMADQDVLKIDIGILYHGWVGDAAWTYVFGEPTETIKKLCQSGKDSLKRGIDKLRPGNTYMEWAKEVQLCVEEEYGFHLIRGLGGHGYGKTLHAPPFISNVVPTFGRSEWPDGYEPCMPGTLIAVEPMIAVTTGEQRSKPKTWPIFTADGSMSVHYEHDVLITDGDPRILTHGLEEIRDVIV